MPEYRLLMQAVRLREVDRDYRNHLQAYLNFVVRARKRAGKNKERPVYGTFQRFYDYEAKVNKVAGRRGAPDRFAGLKNYLRRGEEDENG